MRKFIPAMIVASLLSVFLGVTAFAEEPEVQEEAVSEVSLEAPIPEMEITVEESVAVGEQVSDPEPEVKPEEGVTEAVEAEPITEPEEVMADEAEEVEDVDTEEEVVTEPETEEPVEEPKPEEATEEQPVCEAPQVSYSITFSNGATSFDAVGGTQVAVKDILTGLGYSVEDAVITFNPDTVDPSVIQIADTENGPVLSDYGPFAQADRKLVVYINGDAVELSVEDPVNVDGDSYTADAFADYFVANSAKSQDGHVNLLGNITISDNNPINLSGNHNLYLNGYTINSKSNADDIKGLFTLGPGATLNIVDKELTFTAVEAGSVTFDYVSGTSVQYLDKNTNTWTDYTKGTAVELAEGDKVSFRGTAVKTGEDNHFSMSGTIEASGDVTSLTNGTGGDPALNAECYSYMFFQCTDLTTAPNLPATTLAEGCYSYMFCNCNSIETAPELPATTLADFCYYSMFEACESLTSVSTLPATTLAKACYSFMFCNCADLLTAPTISATKLADVYVYPDTQYKCGCCECMFFGCYTLTTAPILLATTLTEHCYYGMFYDCTSLKVCETDNSVDGAKIILKSCPDISAEDCVTDMFSDTLDKEGTAYEPIEGKTYYSALLSSVSVKTPPTKTEYTYGDSVDLTGLVLTCTYDDYDTANLSYADHSSEISATPENLVVGTDALTISYCGKTTTQAITVSPKQLAVTGSTADGKIYDGTTDAAGNLGTVRGIVSGDEGKVTVTIASASFDNKNAGKGKKVTIKYNLSGTQAGNYTVPADSTATADISPRLLAVTGSTADGKIYDGTTDAVAHIGTVDGKVGSDDVTVTILSATFDDKNAGVAKEVTVEYSLTGAQAGNYTAPTDSKTSADISPKNIAVSADDKSKTYGEADPALTATVTGLVGSDTIAYTLKRAEGSNAGTYSIAASGDASQGNYSVTYNAGTLTINRRPVTITADDKIKTYGEADPALTATVAGLVGSDTITYTLKRAEGSNAGTYSIAASGDASQGNYSVTYNAGTLTINRRPATITANDKSKTYGEADPTLTATVTGLLSGDRLNYTLSRTPGESAGIYVITPAENGSNGNYSVTCVPGLLIIKDVVVPVTPSPSDIKIEEAGEIILNDAQKKAIESLSSEVINFIECKLSGSAKGYAGKAITLKAGLLKGCDASTVHIWHIAEDGTMTEVRFSINPKGEVVINDGRLGLYVITR